MFSGAYRSSRLGFGYIETLTLCLAYRQLPTVQIVTQWNGSCGTEAYLSGQLASFRAWTLLVGSSDL